MIQLFHVSKYYDRRLALSDVTLEIEKGEFVLLMGPSGAGKSTLLKLLIGAERPEEGQILVQGRSLSKLRSSEIPLLRRKIGVVLQDFRLLPKKTVFDNVSLPLLVQGASTVEIRRKVTDALRSVGLDHKKDLFPPGLSTGEQQRICIARAIVNGPIMLLADEPTGNLDSKTGETILDLLERLSERHGIAMLLVTHSPQVTRICQRIFEMKDGFIIGQDSIS